MSLEELFVKGTYYCMVGNPIWYVYRAKVGIIAEEIKLIQGMRLTLVEVPIRSHQQVA